MSTPYQKHAMGGRKIKKSKKNNNNNNNKTCKHNMKIFKTLAKKYHVASNGTKKQIANTLSSLRGAYLSKTEINILMPYLSNNKNTRILKHRTTRKKMPKY